MKIAVIGKKVETAVTYYRATVPIGDLCRRNDWQMVIFMPNELTIDVIHHFDVVFLHRPSHYFETELIWMAKQCGVKVWIDIDDLLWKMPLANPANAMFGPKDRDELMKAMLNADAISCSTPALADAIEKEFGRHAVVVPNAWNDRGGEMEPFDETKRPTQILYRGSNTHDGDLFVHRDAFREYEGVRFLFMGSMPWYFAKGYGGHLPVIHHESWTPGILSYFARIRELNPAFFVVPLENNPFNAAKSNIAAIEATDAGAVTIYPSYLPEFSKFPGIPYDSPDHLQRILEEISVTPLSEFRKVWEAARDYVQGNLKLSEINNIRQAIIEALCH